MKKYYNLILFILVLAFFAYIDNGRMKEKENLIFENKLLQEELLNLKDENLMLNYKICKIKKIKNKDCEQYKKDLATKIQIDELVKNTLSKIHE